MSLQHYYVPTTISFTLEDGTTKVFARNEELGRGSFAVVYRVTDQSTKETYAMKVISKISNDISISKRIEERLKNEIEIQTMVNHPNIVKLKYQFSDQFYHYFILEYCPGKNIREYILENKFDRFNESETIKVLRDVISGLVYLHNNDIVHYDLKLENYLIDSNGNIKIADFGLSTFSKEEKGIKFIPVGTPNYMSPEVLHRENRDQSNKVDIWAIGVSTYMMLTGKGPFEGPTRYDTFMNIKKCQLNFPHDIEISMDAKNFIKSILIEDPHQRPTAKELLNHPFLMRSCSEKVRFTKSNGLPQLMRTSQSSEKVQNDMIEIPEKKNKKLPPINSPKRSKNSKISHEEFEIKKNFVVPSNFVSRYCFYKEHFAYILGNGTVGVCFKDSTRIVLDPTEKFAQFYKNLNSCHEVIEIGGNEKDRKKQEKVLYVKKISKYFKNIKSSFDLVNDANYDSNVPLLNVKCYMKKDDSILFKFSDKNIQVNFADYKKLAIFWNSKKVCFFKNIKDKCNLMDLKYVAKMNSDSDELIKLKKSKELLANMATTA